MDTKNHGIPTLTRNKRLWWFHSHWFFCIYTNTYRIYIKRAPATLIKIEGHQRFSFLIIPYYQYQYLQRSKMLENNIFTPNIIVNVRHDWLCDCAVRTMLKQLKQDLTMTTLAARNENEVIMVPTVGSVLFAVSGVRWSVLYRSTWQEPGLIAVKVFSCLICF